MGARCRPLPDDDVQLVVLERGVEFFFEHGLHPVNFIQKQNLPLAQVCKNRRQVTLNLQRRPRRLLKAHIQFIRDDRGKRCLAQARRSEKQHVIQSLTARLRRLQRDRQLLLRLGLPDKLPQPPWSQLQFEALLFFSARSADQPVRWGPQERVFVPRVVRGVVVRDRHAARSVAAQGCRCKPEHFAPSFRGQARPAHPEAHSIPIFASRRAHNMTASSSFVRSCG